MIDKVKEWKQKGYVDIDVWDEIQPLVTVDLPTCKTQSKIILREKREASWPFKPNVN